MRFLLVLCALMFGLAQLLKPATGEFIQQTEFYQLPKKSLDFVAIGSSHAYCTVNPAQFEEITGLKSFTFACAGLSFPKRLCYLKEVYKTQNPKVIYMDATSVDLADEVFEKYRHENFSYLPSSVNRNRYALESVRPYLWEEMLFPLKLYHSNWVNFTGLNVKNLLFQKPVGEKGYVTLTGNNSIHFPQDNIETKVFIDDKKFEVMDNIVELANKHNTKLVLFVAPLSMKNKSAYLSIFERRYRRYENVSYLNMNQ